MTLERLEQRAALRPAAEAATIVVVAAAIAAVTIRAVLDRTGGEPSVPLDDAYIHFQYATALADLRPFEYTPGAAPTAGATSLVWPALLALFVAVGFEGAALVWPAWALGWIAFALLAFDTKRLAEGLTSPLLAWAAAALVLTFGGFVWFAGSGMEVVALAWLLVRTARRSAEWVETEASATAAIVELSVLGIAGPLLRPEGALCSVMAAAVIAWRPRSRSRLWAFVPAAGVLAPSLVYLLSTGEPITTTARAKWLPLNPYQAGGTLFASVGYNLRLFFETLLDGDLWTRVFLPSGGRAIAWLALAAIPIAGFRRRRGGRAGMVLIVALGILAPTTYETFLVNRVRYIWPFAAAWIIGLVLLADLVGDLASRLHADFGHVRFVVAGTFIGFFASRLSDSIDDLAESSDAVRRQQVALGRWARDALPQGSRLGVNDTGAIAYYGGHETFDIVGLTTRGEAKYWTAGAGSRFEHYERLAERERPTHFIVYPDWLGADSLLGEHLTDRTVDATILGGTTMVAHRARYDTLGTGAMPLAPPGGRLIDSLDVADLESERAHGYELARAAQTENIVVEAGLHADGGRSDRTEDRFVLELSPGGTVTLRAAADSPTELSVDAGDRRVGAIELDTRAWQEASIAVPRDAPGGPSSIRVHASRGTFTSMHYWSYD